MQTISVEKADCKLQLLTNKYLTLYLQSLVTSNSSINYNMILNSLYLTAVPYPGISPGISVDITVTNRKFKRNLKHCPMKLSRCIFRPCFWCVSESTLNYLSNERSHDYIWKNRLNIHFSSSRRGTGSPWHLKK